MTQQLNDKLKTQQVRNIAMITFWSQFSVYVLNTVLVLYLTRSVLLDGLGYTEAKAYVFIGVTQAVGYIMPLVGGQMADRVLGVTRAILIGTFLVAIAYLMVMLSGFMVPTWGDKAFIAAYALIPATNSLLLGTTSAVVSRVYASDEAKAKSSMTLYYMAINVGALLATILAPQLLESKYGPLSIFAVVFVGKSICALNYAYRYGIYKNLATPVDLAKFDRKKILQVVGYLVSLYALTLFAYSFPESSSLLIGLGSSAGIAVFMWKTLQLTGQDKTKQFIAILLILEAVVFFVIYNQLNTTLVLFAKNNSDLTMMGYPVSPAHYQMLNPLLIIGLSFVMPKFYQRFTNFNIPYQFSAGTILAGIALIVMYFACINAQHGTTNGNYLVLTYALITIAELWVSAIGLSMIGLYCCHNMIAFAMGVWYLSNSLSNIISGQLAQIVAMPKEGLTAQSSLHIYQHYFFDLGAAAILIGVAMSIVAILLKKQMRHKGISLP